MSRRTATVERGRVLETGASPRRPVRRSAFRGVIVGSVLGALIACGFGAVAAVSVEVVNDAVSGSDTISDCSAASTVTLGPSTYDAANSRNEYADVSYSGVARCEGDTIIITAVDDSDAILATTSGRIPADGDATLDWDAPPGDPPVSATTNLMISIQDT